MDERNDKGGGGRNGSGGRGEGRGGRDDRGPRRDGDRGPRREGGGFRSRDDRGPRRDGDGDRGPRREGGGDRGGFRGRDDRGPRRDDDRGPRREGGGDRGGFRGRDDRGPRRDDDRGPRREGGGDRGGFRGRDDRGPRRDDDRGPRQDGGGDRGGFRGRDDRGPRRDDDRGPRREGGGDRGGFRGRDDRGPRRDDDRGPRREGGGDRGGFRGRNDRGPRRDDDRGPRREGGGDRGGFGGDGDNRPRDRREGRTHFRKTEGREPGRRDKDRPGPQRRPVSVEVRSGQRSSGGQDAQHWIFGRHAVLAALANPKRDIQRLVATEQMAEQAGIAGHALLEKVTRPDMDHMLSRYDADGTTHGGIAAYAATLSPPSVEGLLKPEGRSVVVLLDQVSDPHNVGAIMRTAAAFGARAVIAPERNAAPVTGSLAKAASGALETVPYLRPTNLSRTLAMLKEWGYWRIGLDGGSDKNLDEAMGFERVALVLGSEGKGLRRLTGENCDLLVSIPMSGSVESLNVSNAAAIAMYRLFSR
ncbi:MAG: 23S rRNA (guanosine(2251)-2'-O)-methyltransferase RlmB [Minwuia sp.]|uniref:23S rRNA (guanosine(2251)-2'-O)-methyltransferase RlmB n=1 Tax=Minwuia sp. TaxID=2493630 RepID=UPI003A87A795